jgi:hypothetical protein
MAYFDLDFRRPCEDEDDEWPRADDRDDEPFEEPFKSADELLLDIEGSGDSKVRFRVRAARPSARLLLICCVYWSVKLRAHEVTSGIGGGLFDDMLAELCGVRMSKSGDEGVLSMCSRIRRRRSHSTSSVVGYRGLGAQGWLGVDESRRGGCVEKVRFVESVEQDRGGGV